MHFLSLLRYNIIRGDMPNIPLAPCFTVMPDAGTGGKAILAVARGSIVAFRFLVFDPHFRFGSPFFNGFVIEIYFGLLEVTNEAFASLVEAAGYCSLPS